jgi:hypothetical protein
VHGTAADDGVPVPFRTIGRGQRELNSPLDDHREMQNRLNRCRIVALSSEEESAVGTSATWRGTKTKAAFDPEAAIGAQCELPPLYEFTA